MVYFFVSGGILVYVNVIIVVSFVCGCMRRGIPAVFAACSRHTPTVRVRTGAAHCHLFVNQYESSHVCYNLKYFINVD